MKAYEVRDAFGIDHLVPADRPDPAPPGRGQVRLRVRAVSLNYRDLLVVQGRYNPRLALPVIPCSDASGVVEAVGAGVRRFRVGDRAAPIFCQTWLNGSPQLAQLRSTLGSPGDGTLATSITLDEEGLIETPDYLSHVEAACLPCAAVTAWNALGEGPQPLEPGQTVLIQGSGGVAIFALQIARACGARVIVVSGSPEKFARLTDLGADRVIERQPGWGREVRSWANGRGVDQVVELGGAAQLTESIQAVAAAGTIHLIGVISGMISELDLGPVIMNRLRLQGVLVGSRDSFAALNRFLARHRIHPVVDQQFSLDQSQEAFHCLERGKHLGKLVIVL